MRTIFDLADMIQGHHGDTYEHPNMHAPCKFRSRTGIIRQWENLVKCGFDKDLLFFLGMLSMKMFGMRLDKRSKMIFYMVKSKNTFTMKTISCYYDGTIDKKRIKPCQNSK